MKYPGLIGVDISDSSVKVLQLDHECNVVAFGEGKFPKGVVIEGSIANIEAFSATLNDVLLHTQPNILREENMVLRAVVGLPESKIFTHYIEVPTTTSTKNLDTFVEDDAQKIIPFELDQLYWDYHVVEKKGARTVTFVGVLKADLANYVEALTVARVKPALITGELFSLGNALLPVGNLEENHLIIDMGARSSTIGVFCDDATASASIKVPFGGEYLTQELSVKLSVTLDEAENLKQTIGLDSESMNKQVPKILEECMTEFISKIKEARTFYEEKTRKSITHVILAGGSALLPKIDTYIQEQIGVDVRIADPLQKIKNHSAIGKNSPSIFFTNVIGLAMSGLNPDKSRLNLLTQYRHDTNSTSKEEITLRDIRSFNDAYSMISAFMRSMLSYITPFTRYARKVRQRNVRLIATIAVIVGAVLFLIWTILTYTTL